MDNRVISFSGGRTSAYMVVKYYEGHENEVVIFANTGKERPETLDFIHAVDQYLGGNVVVWIEYARNEFGYVITDYEKASRHGEPFSELITKKNYVPNRVARFCTQELKIRPMKKFCQQVLGWKHWDNWVGIRYDEPRRWDKAKSVARNEVYDMHHPLVVDRITETDVLEYWKSMPFDLGIHTLYGNCDLCFLKGQAKKAKIIRENPDVAKWWIEQENKVKGTFHPAFSISQLADQVRRSPELFDTDIDDSIDCFCNTD